MTGRRERRSIAPMPRLTPFERITLAVEAQIPLVRAMEAELGKERAHKLVRAALDPLGGSRDARSPWPFGEPVRPSALRRQAQLALERQAAVLDLAIGLDGNEPDERCEDVRIGPHELVYLDRLELEVRPELIPSGGLR